MESAIRRGIRRATIQMRRPYHFLQIMARFQNEVNFSADSFQEAARQVFKTSSQFYEMPSAALRDLGDV